MMVNLVRVAKLAYPACPTTNLSIIGWGGLIYNGGLNISPTMVWPAKIA